jgi:hypothetical protein
MRARVRYALIFSAAVIAGVYVHELGHAVAGWINGVAVFPTPAKEYVLQAQLDWNTETWIALGGVIGTTVATLAAALYFWRKPSSASEAILAGAFIPPGLYTIRFLLVGRGHDGTEWQAAQAALGLSPAGHAIDVFFLCLLIAGFIIWGVRLHPAPRSVVKIVALAIAGAILLVALQVGNNAVFDRVFPAVKVINIPGGLGPR